MSSKYLQREAQTLCGLTTAKGRSGLAVVRVSGANALGVALKVCPGLLNKKLESHRAYRCDFVKAGKVFDSGLILYFEQGRSFTGEQTVEFFTHGSPLIVEQLIQSLVEAGALVALPGEFSFRAFINGRIDLVQAESIHQLVESRSELLNRFVLSSLKGQSSKAIMKLEDELVEILAHVEADIDFSTENLHTLSEAELRSKLRAVLEQLERIIRLAEEGRKLRSGFRAVFLGPPNVGKSTLFNALFQDDVALVSPFAGTTRDVVKERCFIEGFEIEVADTAGIHETEEQLELLGIAKTKSRADQSDILIFVMTPGQQIEPPLQSMLSSASARGQKVLVVVNKADLVSEKEMNEVVSNLKKSFETDFSGEFKILVLSGLQSQTAGQAIRDELHKMLAVCEVSQAMSFSDWQFDILTSAYSNLLKANHALLSGVSSEFYALDLREALYSLQELLGKRFEDDILDRVFSRFCIGK